MAIRVNAIQETRRIARAESINAIGVGLALLGDHVKYFFLKLIRRLRFGTLQKQHAEARRRERPRSGTSVAIRSREVSDGLAADQIVVEHSVFDDVYGLGFDTFVVHVVAAHQAVSLKVLERGVVDDGEEPRQYARLVAGGKSTDGANGLARLRLATHDVRTHKRGDHIIGGIRSEKYRSAIFLLDNGRFAKRDYGFEGLPHVTEQFIARRKFFRAANHPVRIAAQAHAVFSLRRAIQLKVIRSLAVARDGAFGIDKVFVDR